MTAVYKIPGIIASGALIAYTLICYASLKLFGATLTLPGIAGFILTIGMAVDANVIIFERIKEEVARGDSEKKAIQNGFSRAFTAILDSNVTTLISSIVLFLLGSGTIKGFAVTLSLGVIVSMFSAIFLTRLLLDLCSSKQLFKVKK
jgi:preprotein translocase subunit SecD